MTSRTVRLTTIAGLVGLLAALAAEAQFGGRRGREYTRVVMGELPPERTGFTFCRLVYSANTREQGGSGWNTDYPLADQNLMIRLPEFTLARVTNYTDGSPQHALFMATDPKLFRCPFLFASDVGTTFFSQPEVEALRTYLQKGGFLWVDDFWGTGAWLHWMEQIRRVLPDYEPQELPMDHPIFDTFYTLEKVPQIPSIQLWRTTGGSTSERGLDSDRPEVFGIFDSGGRLMVLMSHNTDIADGWEREGEEIEFFHSFSPLGYAVGVNVVIWSMTR